MLALKGLFVDLALEQYEFSFNQNCMHFYKVLLTVKLCHLCLKGIDFLPKLHL